jgi:hypothetical protein
LLGAYRVDGNVARIGQFTVNADNTITFPYIEAYLSATVICDLEYLSSTTALLLYKDTSGALKVGVVNDTTPATGFGTPVTLATTNVASSASMQRISDRKYVVSWSEDTTHKICIVSLSSTALGATLTVGTP